MRSIFFLLILFLTVGWGGCLTTELTVYRSPDGTIKVTQPKDVVFKELIYTVSQDFTMLEIKGYSSAVNTQALQIQSDTISNVAKGVAEGLAGIIKKGTVMSVPLSSNNIVNE